MFKDQYAENLYSSYGKNWSCPPADVDAEGTWLQTRLRTRREKDVRIDPRNEASLRVCSNGMKADIRNAVVFSVHTEATVSGSPTASLGTAANALTRSRARIPTNFCPLHPPWRSTSAPTSHPSGSSSPSKITESHSTLSSCTPPVRECAMHVLA